MTTLIDTNVLLDLATDDPVWASWSLSKLDGASLSGPIVINPIIYAELAARYPDTQTLDEFVVRLGTDVEDIPKAGLFLAGKAFQHIRCHPGLEPGPILRCVTCRKVVVPVSTTLRLWRDLEMGPGSSPG